MLVAETTPSVVFTYSETLVTLKVHSGDNAGSDLGQDLSGTLQGAGGVGGLLSFHNASTNTSIAYTYVYDGNGNVLALVDLSTGAIRADYEYSPFGETIRSSGPLAEENTFRSSTKYTDDKTGLVYYGLRYYSPNTGRWLSRDPIAESGGLNLQTFVFNNPTRYFDVLGREAGTGFGGNLGSHINGQQSGRQRETRYRYFVWVEDILPGGEVVRKVAALDHDLAAQIGLKPTGSSAPVSPGQHALGAKPSPFLSGSTRPGGAGGINGKALWIDIPKFEAAGGQIISGEQILEDLNRMVTFGSDQWMWL